MLIANRVGFVACLANEDELAPTTIKQYLQRADFLEGKLGKPLEALTSDDLRRLKVELRGAYSSAYIKGVVVLARRFHLWGAAEGKWPLNGVMNVKPPKERNNSPRPLPPEKVRLILSMARGPLEIRAVYLPAFAGTRVGESAAIGEREWQDGWFDFIGKGGKRRQVPVHPTLAAMRSAILAHPYPNKDSLPDAKERVEDKVGFRFVLHQLRKSFATTLHNNGTKELCRKELMGHATGLAGVYVDVSDAEKVEAVEGVDY